MSQPLHTPPDLPVATEMEKSSSPSRKVFLFERFELATRNAGYPPILTFLARFHSHPDPAAPVRPTLQTLSDKVDLLQDHFPLLWATIAGPKSTEPRFLPRGNGKWQASEIVRVQEMVAGSRDDAKSGKDMESHQVLKEELTRMLDQESDAPTWQVTLFIRSGTPTSSVYLTLSLDHVIADGIGGLRLFLLLLHPHPEAILDSLPTEVMAHLPGIEDTLPVAPTPLERVKGGLLPWLAPFLSASFFETPNSLVDRAGERTLDAPWDLSLGSVSAEVMQSLKALGRDRGVRTLHPILHCVLLVALWSVVWAPGHPEETFAVASTTAKSERQAQLGHAFCTTLCTSFLERLNTLGPELDFWPFVRSYADFMQSRSALKNARTVSRRLNGIPNHALVGLGQTRPTTWEALLLGRVESMPLRWSIGLSNLGYVDSSDGMENTRNNPSAITLPKGLVEDLMWTQHTSPFVGPVIATILGFEAGLRWTLSFRDGAAVTEEEADRVNRVAERILERLAEGVVGAAVSLEELVKPLKT